MPQLWSSSCTAEAAGEKKLIRKELHDIKYTRAYGSHVITEYTYNEAGKKASERCYGTDDQMTACNVRKVMRALRINMTEMAM